LDYNTLEAKLMDSLDETKFAQDFEQSSKLLDSTTLYRAAGAGISGTVGGIISSVIPGGLTFGGSAMPSIIGGILLKKFGGQGKLHLVGEGIMISGIGQFIQNLLPSMSSLVEQPSRPELESETKSKEKISGVVY
tara:strand:+ start:804 stop:1208 length:405 start_codon:yes stop_codon:yes gene_type:complete